jgi:Kef-type K+ transport system membrane component KefB
MAALSFSLTLGIVLLVALGGRRVALRLGQPAVLGELLAGILLGTLHAPLLQAGLGNGWLDHLAELGVLLLLFQTGLESTVPQMLAVGGAALRVASIGVVVPLVLGWLVARLLLPQEPMAVHAFLGATLTATSVGITARVLRDLNASQSTAARLILGAAVIDDVLGLVLLAVVTGAIASGTVQPSAVALIACKAVLFLLLSVPLGAWSVRRLVRIAVRLHPVGGMLAVGLSVCAALSWLSALAGLAPIVGAFVAGLVFDVDSGATLSRRLARPGALLSSIFFVLMGMRIDLNSLILPGAMPFAFALLAVAILGKVIAGVGAGKGIDRLTVGLGMIPRGEVGLIFAGIGQRLFVDGKAVIDARTYSAVLLMVVITTLVTPPLLRWRIARVGQSA